MLQEQLKVQNTKSRNSKQFFVLSEYDTVTATTTNNTKVLP